MSRTSIYEKRCSLKPIKTLLCFGSDFSRRGFDLHLVYLPSENKIIPFSSSEQYDFKNWCGNITHYVKGEAVYQVFDLFNKGAVAATWGLMADVENWAEAVLIDGQWFLLEEGEHFIFSGGNKPNPKRIEEVSIVLIKKRENPKILVQVTR